MDSHFLKFDIIIHNTNDIFERNKNFRGKKPTCFETVIENEDVKEIALLISEYSIGYTDDCFIC